MSHDLGRPGEFPTAKRDTIEQDFEVLAAPMVLDRNSQVSLHQPMLSKGLAKISRARRRAWTEA
jgi:hypothetical protein